MHEDVLLRSSPAGFLEIYCAKTLVHGICNAISVIITPQEQTPVSWWFICSQGRKSMGLSSMCHHKFIADILTASCIIILPEEKISIFMYIDFVHSTGRGTKILPGFRVKNKPTKA